MKGKKHNPEQIIKKLREADAMMSGGKTIGQVCQSLEVSEQTFHRWRNQYGGMKSSGAKRLKELEQHSALRDGSRGCWPTRTLTTTSSSQCWIT